MQYKSLTKLLGSISYERDYRLSVLSRYGTGGVADLIIFPADCNELKYALSHVKNNYNYFVIGGGSNLLISDDGYRGVIISTKNLQNTCLNGSLYTAESGVKLKTVVNEMKTNCFSGLEFTVGIPATVGGAVAMNAGCYGKSISDRICYVVTDEDSYNVKNCNFGYRKSRFLLNNEVILKVCFSFTPQEEDYVEEKINLYKSFRKTPKGRNCGSVFKNDGYFAGKIIDEVGLKGFSVGNAKISNEHANFIIAENGATSTDIYNLIKHVKKSVYEKKQINLYEEIVYLGDFK